METVKIFIGYDKREKIAYDVCKFSIEKHSSIPTEIVPLKQDYLRSTGLFYRDIDPLSSTEFTFTRFLIPELMSYSGMAIFCDCDFLFTQDIKNLVDQFNSDKALQVVKHNYTPTNIYKMDGSKQTVYDRKNWSSLVLWNCGHEANKKLTSKLVNTESGLFLHQFKWLSDNDIGEIDRRWNHLVGVNSSTELPYGIHYTNGGPWFDNYKDCEYHDVWIRYYNEMISI